MPKKITTKDFIDRARDIHGDKYDYSLVNYTGMTELITINCKIHGNFQQIADSHLRTGGCWLCGRETTQSKTRHSNMQFIEKAQRVHGNKYLYNNINYIGDAYNISIRCPVHGEFTLKATSHLQGSGCQKCAKRYKRTSQEFINEAKAIHGHKYDYSLTIFSRMKTDVEIYCKKHGIFKQNPTVHLKGGECPGCRIRQYSKKCIEWLSYIEHKENVKIQHALHGGEFKIPNTKCVVDGFCAETNTVYEFYGDMYHGNPKIYKPNQRPFSSYRYTAKQLLSRTARKERLIKSLGFNLITIWESDWNEKVKEMRRIH